MVMVMVMVITDGDSDGNGSDSSSSSSSSGSSSSADGDGDGGGYSGGWLNRVLLKLMLISVSRSCAVAYRENFWQATRQSNLVDRMEETVLVTIVT